MVASAVVHFDQKVWLGAPVVRVPALRLRICVEIHACVRLCVCVCVLCLCCVYVLLFVFASAGAAVSQSCTHINTFFLCSPSLSHTLSYSCSFACSLTLSQNPRSSTMARPFLFAALVVAVTGSQALLLESRVARVPQRASGQRQVSATNSRDNTRLRLRGGGPVGQKSVPVFLMLPLDTLNSTTLQVGLRCVYSCGLHTHAHIFLEYYRHAWRCHLNPPHTFSPLVCSFPRTFLNSCRVLPMWGQRVSCSTCGGVFVSKSPTNTNLQDIWI